MMLRLFVAGAAMGLWLLGCQQRAVSPTGLAMTKVTIGAQSFALEIANTDATRMRGLMYRTSMPADQGMIFVFPDEQPLSFYMKNTQIPLDILFLDAGGRIVSIHQMQPYVEWPSTHSAGPAKYAIELNQGAAAKAGAKVGEVISIPVEARDAVE